MDGYDEDDVEELPSGGHIDRQRDGLTTAIAKYRAGDKAAFDDYELECIHESTRWHPRHVLVLIRALKRAHDEIEDVQGGLDYNEELLAEVDEALAAGMHTEDLRQRATERHRDRVDYANHPSERYIEDDSNE